MNFILFRSFIFKKRKKKISVQESGDEIDTQEIDLGTAE